MVTHSEPERDAGVERCSVCGQEFDPHAPESLYAEAGELLAEEVWQDAGELCPLCRENRARLAMMYCQELYR